MLTLDGSRGEGGGQLLRTALSLSLCLRVPFRIDNIRAHRRQPGLRPQHVAVVNAAATISSAHVEGATLGSQHLVFQPDTVRAGSYRFDIGTAGSATLLLQTLLLPLLGAPGISQIVVLGGTHNPLAPPYEFLAQTFIPLLSSMGAKVETRLVRHGFYPAGGGEIQARIDPAHRLEPLILEARGALLKCAARALLAHLPDQIGERELRVAAHRLGLHPEQLSLERIASVGPGNAFIISAICERISETFTAIGERGVPAEKIAQAATSEASDWLDAGVAAGGHLADQLLLPMALGGGGCFTTQEPTRHTLTNMEIITQFTNARFSVSQISAKSWRIDVS